MEKVKYAKWIILGTEYATGFKQLAIDSEGLVTSSGKYFWWVAQLFWCAKTQKCRFDREGVEC